MPNPDPTTTTRGPAHRPVLRLACPHCGSTRLSSVEQVTATGRCHAITLDADGTAKIEDSTLGMVDAAPRSAAETLGRGAFAMRRQFWAALAGGGSSALLAVMTLISREWIEFLFGVDPDNGNGGLEWAIVVVTAVSSVVCFWWARGEWKRARFSEVTPHG